MATLEFLDASHLIAPQGMVIVEHSSESATDRPARSPRAHSLGRTGRCGAEFLSPGSRSVAGAHPISSTYNARTDAYSSATRPTAASGFLDRAGAAFATASPRPRDRLGIPARGIHQQPARCRERTARAERSRTHKRPRLSRRLDSREGSGQSFHGIIFVARCGDLAFDPAHLGFLARAHSHACSGANRIDMVPASNLICREFRCPLPSPPLREKQKNIAPSVPESPGADASHARQTILSIPVRVTHPRQTLIRPDAPSAPPKVVPQLPNIVQWSSDQPQKPKFQLSVANSAPKVRRRAIRDDAAPEVANSAKNLVPFNVVSKASAIPRPKMPVSAMSAPVARQRETRAEATAAPEIGAADSNSSRPIIALSATPGPPVPVAEVPEGNLAARISTSPDGKKPGAVGNAANHSTGPGAGGGARVFGDWRRGCRVQFRFAPRSDQYRWRRRASQPGGHRPIGQPFEHFESESAEYLSAVQ